MRGLRTLLPRADDVPWLIGYAIAFVLAHRVAFIWSGQGYYSVLFPAAGVRFALLWHRGPRLTVAVALAEVAVQTLTGVVRLTEGDWMTEAVNVARPALVYGGVIAAVKRIVARITARSGSGLCIAPMPLGLAAVAAPLAAAVAALPWSLLRPDLTGVVGLRETIASLTGFAVGDLLGVLLFAPAILRIVDAGGDDAGPGTLAGSSPRLVVLEVSAVLALALAGGAMLHHIGLGPQPTPVLLAVAWIGLRFGRAAGWAAIVAVTAIVLPQTTGGMALAERLAMHMNLASIAVVGYIAGSFADAQSRARADLERRDRLLFQAERLKTLRAMSVAVIHEISQPLSTLTIEASHLHAITAQSGARHDEVAATAALIHRKAAALSTLVRRLRRFGGPAADEPGALPLAALMHTVADLAQAEVKAANVTLHIAPVDPALVVIGQEVELAQAVINLVRNAVQACDGEVSVTTGLRAGLAAVTVRNRCADRPTPHSGMGVGTLIARAIVEAHGGTVERCHGDGGEVVATMLLPLAKAAA